MDADHPQNGVLIPRLFTGKTPSALLERLASTVGKAMDSPDLLAKLKPLEFYPAVTCGAKFAEFLRVENEATGRVVRDAGIKME